MDETLVSCKTDFIPKELYESILKKSGSYSSTVDSPFHKTVFQTFYDVIDYDEQHSLKLIISFRPNLKDVLEYLSNNFEVGVFTAGDQKYADAIINKIDPFGEYFSFRLYR